MQFWYYHKIVIIISNSGVCQYFLCLMFVTHSSAVRSKMYFDVVQLCILYFNFSIYCKQYYFIKLLKFDLIFTFDIVATNKKILFLCVSDSLLGLWGKHRRNITGPSWLSHWRKGSLCRYMHCVGMAVTENRGYMPFNELQQSNQFAGTFEG